MRRQQWTRTRTVGGSLAIVGLLLAMACSGDDAATPDTAPDTTSPTIDQPAPTGDDQDDDGQDDDGQDDDGQDDDGQDDDGSDVDDASGERVDAATVAGLSVLGDDRPDATGSGVMVVVIDSGVDWRHPDLRTADGATRLAAIVDLADQTRGCVADRPPPRVFERDEIDRALAEGSDLGHVDVVGRGTALAGLAAGNGAASDGWISGAATDATIIAVKQVSEGVPPSDVGPGGSPVLGCIDDALDEVDRLLDQYSMPAVLLVGTGAQWGPLDGTSATSRRLAASFGPETPGRVLVTGAGDEGGRPNHARVRVTSSDPSMTVPFDRVRSERSNPTIWYSGAPVSVSIRFDDGAMVGPVGPGESASDAGVEITHYVPGTQFHPWTSTSDDRAVWIVIDRPPGSGELVVELLGSGDDDSALVDVYGDVLGPVAGSSSIEFADHLAPAAVTDVASTPGAVVATAHVARNSWSDRHGRLIEPSPVLDVGSAWPGATVGQTRDDRRVIAVSAPGHHAVAPLASASMLAARDELHPHIGPVDEVDPQIAPDGPSSYVVVPGTGAAAAIVAGVVASMLEVSPDLTGPEIAELLAGAAADGRLRAAAAVEAARDVGR